jgi:hypothetical protein
MGLRKKMSLDGIMDLLVSNQKNLSFEKRMHSKLKLSMFIPQVLIHCFSMMRHQ